jgi:multiple sugar transport system permease protein
MSSTQQALIAEARVPLQQPPRSQGHTRLRGSDFAWAVAFVLPYAIVLLAFAVCPIVYALWQASAPSLYADLAADPTYWSTVVNTLIFVGLGVNLKMFLALLMSGFFMRRC